MARYTFLLLLLVCFIYALQASPLPEGETTTTNDENAAKKLQDAVQNAAQTFGKAVEDFFKDPKLNEYVDSGKKFFENAAESVKKEFEKLVPKTESTTS